jgi:hypothetical protein
MVDFTGLRSGILANFGEPVIVTVGGVEHPLTAAFLEAHVGQDIGGVPVNRPDPQIVTRTEDWEAIEAEREDIITRNSIRYTVVDTMPTDDGMTTVILRRYA